MHYAGFQLCLHSIRTASGNSMESDLGCTSRVYFDNVTLTLHNVARASHKACKYINKFDCSETNGYNISQYAINEFVVFLYSDILLKKLSFIILLTE